MKTHVTILAAAALAAAGAVTAKEAIEDAHLGLSKTSVFEAPTPQPVDYDQAPAPGPDVKALPRYHPEAPPQIPHRIGDFVPIRPGENQCMACHDKPMLIGQDIPGVPTPIPASHYQEPGKEGEEVQQGVDGSRFLCTQCHAPQTDAPPLVENTLE